METIFILLVIFQIKHFIADYPLQFPYMYENKGKRFGWILPLSDHAAVHGLFTLLILVGLSVFSVISTPVLLIAALGTMDYVTHFAIDRWKATRGVGPDTSAFWMHLGIDQMLHHLVGIIIIYAVVS